MRRSARRTRTLIGLLIVLSLSPACRGQGPARQTQHSLPEVARTATPAAGILNPTPPTSPVRLVFIHRSTGEAWLSDTHGGLGLALRDNNYVVSDTHYGWGPGSIGDTTDIGHWYDWFGDGRDTAVLEALYGETGQNSSYSRLSVNPGGQNEIILFKSCFPNSALGGSASTTAPEILSNPLRSQSAGSAAHTVANARGIYTNLLSYFQTRPDKLFVVITAPPLQDATHSSNARLFNEWLVKEWLIGYPLHNVAVFDFYNVLTTIGRDANTNDLAAVSGNHHRFADGRIEYISDGDDDANANVLEYPTGDDHPSAAGDLKATGEFVPLLNLYYHLWKP